MVGMGCVWLSLVLASFLSLSSCGIFVGDALGRSGVSSGHAAIASPLHQLPGIRLVTSSAAIEAAGVKAIDDAIKKIERTKLKIPDFVTEVDTPIGHIHVWVSNMVLSGSSVSKDAKVSLRKGVGFDAVFGGVDTTIALDWRWKTDGFIKVSDHGSATIGVTGAALDVELEIGKAKTGSLSVKDLKNEIDLGTWDLTLQSKYSWFYDLFKNTITKDIRSGATTAIDDETKSYVQHIIKGFLGEISTYVPITNTSELDVALLSAPSITSHYVTLDMDGKGLSDAHLHANPPFAATTKLPLSLNASSMVQIFLSEYVFNSYTWALYHAKALNFLITPALIPPTVPFQLNTSDFKSVVPALYKNYPNDGMEISIVANAAPHATIYASGINVSGSADMTFKVVEPNGTIVPAFTCEGTLSLSITADVYNASVYGKIQHAAFNISLESSRIGPFDIKPLSSLVDFAFLVVGVPQLNTYLSKGIPLPSFKEISIIQPHLHFGSGFVAVETDFKYTPTRTGTSRL